MQRVRKKQPRPRAGSARHHRRARARRAARRWCSRCGPIPSTWRNGGARTASPPRPARFDMRAGGVWRFVMHGPDGRDYENRITFDEIVKPERLRLSPRRRRRRRAGAVPHHRHLRGPGRQPDPPHLARGVPVGRRARSRDQGIRRRQGRGADAVAPRRLRGDADRRSETETSTRGRTEMQMSSQKDHALPVVRHRRPRRRRTTTFPSSRIPRSARSAATARRGRKFTARRPGSVMTVEFEIEGPEIRRAQRRPAVQVQRGDLVPDPLRDPGRGRLLLEQALRGRLTKDHAAG